MPHPGGDPSFSQSTSLHEEAMGRWNLRPDFRWGMKGGSRNRNKGINIVGGGARVRK
jgi:hypothetical protein